MDPAAILALLADLYTQLRAEAARADTAEAELRRLHTTTETADSGPPVS